MTETPRRMAHAYAEMLTSDSFDFTTFANAEGYDELVVVEDIPVRSVCEHHMLPFAGVAHLGYLPADRILGLSKLARLVEFYAHRAQTQERLTQQIAEHLDRHLAPRGVGVVIEAEHTCMSLRGVRAADTRTVTSALLGTLRTDPSSRAEFLSLTRGAGRGADDDRHTDLRRSSAQGWLPARPCRSCGRAASTGTSCSTAPRPTCPTSGRRSPRGT